MGVPTLSVDRPFLSPNGLARSAKAIICEDTFANSNDGWLQLFTPDSDQTTGPDFGQRIYGTLTRVQRGPWLMALRSPGIADTTAQPVATMGIKRIANHYGPGRYMMEMVVSVECAVSQLDRPVDFAWGLDTATESGLRRFFRARFWNYDETNSQTRKKFQIKTAAGSLDSAYTDVAGGAVDLTVLTNENKALPFYLAMVVNTATGCWEGFRFGNFIKVGTLADTPDTSLIDLGPMSTESLPTFASGLNPLFEIVNRSSAGRTQSQSNLHWHRLTFLGA